ncbi:hypothetical protein DFH07DRAFT_951771 [Mycena maculata]|uniref:Uncharacterized protein n=1 Tax=Mycena maculata TaxID=230809 RepID=A0AAD7K229_9AGAR|nr:hypothetical protein DFH07DRAFT_951771 [Mycena maculata]
MARQERLRGRPPGRRLIWFESNAEENDAQGNTDGLGDVDDTGAPFTMRWDNQIQPTAANMFGGKSLTAFAASPHRYHGRVMPGLAARHWKDIRD